MCMFAYVCQEYDLQADMQHYDDFFYLCNETLQLLPFSCFCDFNKISINCSAVGESELKPVKFRAGQINNEQTSLWISTQQREADNNL